MEILLIRHGKTFGNYQKRYIGVTDESLTEAAVDELRRTNYRAFKPDVVYTSKMLRCRQTAEVLFSGDYMVWPGLGEMDFGDFEYKTYEQLSWNPQYRAWIDSEGLGPIPNGESGEHFRDRCATAFYNCLMDAVERDAKKIVVVAHGGTIMAIMERYGIPQKKFYEWQLQNGDCMHVRCKEWSEENCCLELIG